MNDFSRIINIVIELLKLDSIHIFFKKANSKDESLTIMLIYLSMRTEEKKGLMHIGVSQEEVIQSF
jgi:hypothetical protein